MLGLLALAAIPALRRYPWRYLGLLLLAGVGQEAFQLLYKRRLLVFDDTRDLATDLVGLLVAFAIVSIGGRLRAELRSRRACATTPQPHPGGRVGRSDVMRSEIRE
jgi:hypothetical protein